MDLITISSGKDINSLSSVKSLISNKYIPKNKTETMEHKDLPPTFETVNAEPKLVQTTGENKESFSADDVEKALKNLTIKQSENDTIQKAGSYDTDVMGTAPPGPFIDDSVPLKLKEIKRRTHLLMMGGAENDSNKTKTEQKKSMNSPKTPNKPTIKSPMKTTPKTPNEPSVKSPIKTAPKTPTGPSVKSETVKSSVKPTPKSETIKSSSKITPTSENIRSSVKTTPKSETIKTSVKTTPKSSKSASEQYISDKELSQLNPEDLFETVTSEGSISSGKKRKKKSTDSDEKKRKRKSTDRSHTPSEKKNVKVVKEYQKPYKINERHVSSYSESGSDIFTATG